MIPNKNSGKGSSGNRWKIWVNNVPYYLGKDNLKLYFSNYGKISKVSLLEKGASLKVSITCADKHTYFRILEKNKHSLKNHPISCEPVNKDEYRKLKTESDNKYAFLNHNKIHICGLTRHSSESGLREYFGQFGKVQYFKVVFDKPSRGYAFLQLDSDAGTQEIIQKKRHKIDKGIYICTLYDKGGRGASEQGAPSGVSDSLSASSPLLPPHQGDPFWRERQFEEPCSPLSPEAIGEFDYSASLNQNWASESSYHPGSELSPTFEIESAGLMKKKKRSKPGSKKTSGSLIDSPEIRQKQVSLNPRNCFGRDKTMFGDNHPYEISHAVGSSGELQAAPPTIKRKASSSMRNLRESEPSNSNQNFSSAIGFEKPIKNLLSPDDAPRNREIKVGVPEEPLTEDICSGPANSDPLKIEEKTTSPNKSQGESLENNPQKDKVVGLWRGYGVPVDKFSAFLTGRSSQGCSGSVSSAPQKLGKKMAKAEATSLQGQSLTQPRSSREQERFDLKARNSIRPFLLEPCTNFDLEGSGNYLNASSWHGPGLGCFGPQGGFLSSQPCMPNSATLEATQSASFQKFQAEEQGPFSSTLPQCKKSSK